MASRIKWWINGIAAFIFIMLCIIYLLIRPIITQYLEPVIKDAAGERINGTLTWTMMDLDPNYDLSFTDLELKDAKGEVVFKSPLWRSDGLLLRCITMPSKTAASLMS